MQKRWTQPGSLFIKPPASPPTPPAKTNAMKKLWWPLRLALWIFRRISLLIGGMVLTGLLIAFFAAASGPLKQAEMPDAMILTLRLDDGLKDDDGAGESLLAALQQADKNRMSVRDIVDALDAAAADPRVKGLALDIQSGDYGSANVQEVRAALKRFRAAGKPAWAYSPSYAEAGGNMGSYYLAAACDEIWMQPAGFLTLPGYDAEAPFVADTLREIGIEPQFFQRKEYKSVMENFARNGMSDANREMMNSLLNDITGVLVADIAADRKIPKETLRQDIDQGLFTEKEALQAKLVDHIDFDDAMLASMKAKLGYAAADKSLKKYSMEDYWDAHDGDGFDGHDKIALIAANGEIVADGGGGMTGGTVVTPTKLVDAFQSAVKDKKVKAIVFRIDSPGGSPTASETIRHAVQNAIAHGKPVIVSMGSMAGSGGYWIAVDATRIFALPATLTGSIGVAGGKVDLSGLMKKLKINWDGVQIGKNADMDSLTKPFSASGTERMNAMMDSIYSAFIDRVAKGRKLMPETVEKIAKGRVWTGHQALANGLVDQLGGLDAALDYAAVMAGRKKRNDFDIVAFPKPKTPVEQLFSLLNADATMQKIGGVLMQKLNALVSESRTPKISAYNPVLNQKL